MRKSFAISIQKLFIVTIFLKVLSSAIGWYINDPRYFGFAVPLLFMAAYVYLGHNRRDTTVSDERFADTCYYLGFIFTITSIIFSLLDLPYIGTRINEIAARFGAAMVSTALGLLVRVYLVSFKEEMAEALVAAEDAALEATRRLREQMVVALESLESFEQHVHTSAKGSIDRVNLEIENLGKAQAKKLDEFFIELTDRNQEAFLRTFGDVQSATRNLADSVDAYGKGMQKNLASIETRIDTFTQAISTRLAQTTFPDDYFSKRLQEPVARLVDGAALLADEVKRTSSGVSDSASVMMKALNKLQLKASAAEASLDSIARLTGQQQAVLDSASDHIEKLGTVADVLTKTETALNGTVELIKDNNLSAKTLVDSVSLVVAESVDARRNLDASIAHVIDKLDSQAEAALDVAKTLDASASASINAATALGKSMEDAAATARSTATALAAVLSESTQNTRAALGRLDEAVGGSTSLADGLERLHRTEAATTASLDNVAKQAALTAERAAQATHKLEDVSDRLLAMESALHAQGVDVSSVTAMLANVERRIGDHARPTSTDLAPKGPTEEEGVVPAEPQSRPDQSKDLDASVA